MEIKSEILREFELSLLSEFNPEQIKIISNKFLVSLEEYDIVKKSKEIIPYDYSNEILLRNFHGCLIISGKSPLTAEQYISELRRFIKFKGKKLTDITPIDLKEYIAYKLAVCGVSKSTANNIRNRLSSFFQWLTEEGYVEVNPCTTLKSVKQEKKIKEIFSEVELDRMRSLKMYPRDRAIIEVLFSTGVRVEELCNLNISDVNFQESTVFVRGGKGQKDRIVYMSKVATYHLDIYLKSRNDNQEALFLNYPNRNDVWKSRITDSGIRAILRQVGKKLGISKCHPHKFRRTLATMLYKKGMDLHEIQQILGHEDISVTMGYIVSDNTMTKHSYNKYMN